MRWKVDATEWDEMNTIWCQSTLKGMKRCARCCLFFSTYDMTEESFMICDGLMYIYIPCAVGWYGLWTLFLSHPRWSLNSMHPPLKHRGRSWALGWKGLWGGGCRGGRSSKMFFVKIKGIQKSKRGFTSSINYFWFLDDLEFRSFWEYGLIHRHHVNGSAMTLSIYVTQERFRMIESAGCLPVAISATKWRMHTNSTDLV